MEYMEKGLGGAHIATGVAWYESDNDVSLDEIAEELDVTRVGLYNARVKLELEMSEPRGKYVQD